MTLWVYRFDYSKVALIVTTEHEAIARIIDERLDRGATYLHGAGSYTKQEMEIVLTVVKKEAAGRAEGNCHEH